MAHIGDNTVSVIEEVADPAPGSDAAIVRIADETLPPGVSQVDFDAALAAGREKGHLTQDELIDSLHNVELTPEVLGALLARINAEGVALVEDDEIAAEIEERVQARAAARTDAASANGTRRKTNGKRPTTAESSGSAEDPVHT